MSTGFANFDPLQPYLSWSPCSEAREIASRAAALLKGRTQEQILTAVQSIDWILDQQLERLNSQRPHEPLDRGEVSDTRLFHSCYREIEWDDPDLISASPAEYFAALALWKVDQALTVLGELNARRSTLTAVLPTEWVPTEGSWRLPFGFNLLLEAMDAVAVADQIRTETLWQAHADQEAERKLKERISVRNSKAAISKNAKNNQVKEKAIELYEAGRFQSVRAAAFELEEQLRAFAKEIGANILYTERAPITIQEWIGKHLKRTRARV